MSLGDKVTFRGYKLIIVKKEASLRNGLLEIWYTLGYEQCFGEVRHTNRKISGMSILGTVLETKGELLQLHLEIDEKPTGTNWYRYAPATGNMLYCMPKKGTEVSLYFPDDEEAHAVVINCIRKNGTSCAQMSNPAMRQLSTEHGKNLSLSPESVSIFSKLNQMNLTDASNVNLSSGLSVAIRSKQSIHVLAKQTLTLNAGLEFVAQRNPFVLTRFDGTSMADKADYVVYTGESQQYKDCEQMDVPKPKDHSDVGLKVLAGLAVVGLCALGAVFIASAVVSGGATLAMSPAMIGAATFIIGSIPVVSKGMSDCESGEVGSVMDYTNLGFTSGIRTTVEVLTFAACPAETLKTLSGFVGISALSSAMGSMTQQFMMGKMDVATVTEDAIMGGALGGVFWGGGKLFKGLVSKVMQKIKFRLPQGTGNANKGYAENIRYRIGQSVEPIEKQLDHYLNPESYIQEVVDKYGINLKGSGQKIEIKYDQNYLKGPGYVSELCPNTIILGPQALRSEAELANTIAHELNHWRSWLKGGVAPEPPAYNAGDSLEDYINGRR